MRDAGPNSILDGYDRYYDELPITPEDRLFGPFVYGSEPVTGESFSVRRMQHLLESIESAAERTYPEYPRITTDVVNSLVEDERMGMWSGYVAVCAINGIPTGSPNTTLSLVVETLSGSLLNRKNQYKNADATRASLLWHDHTTQQGIAMSVTTNGNGYYHGLPSISRLNFADDRTDSVIGRVQLSATDAQIGQAFDVAEQALRSLEGHGRKITGPNDVVLSDRRPYIAVLTVNDENLAPHHFTPPELMRKYPWRSVDQERWRHQP